MTRPADPRGASRRGSTDAGDLGYTSANDAPAKQVAEAAELLQVSTKTLRRWTRDGIAHAMRTPTNHRRFTLAEIERLMPRTTEPEAQEAA